MGFSALTANTLTHTHTHTQKHAHTHATMHTHAHRQTSVMRPVCGTHQDAHIFPLSAWKIYTPLSAHLSVSTPHPPHLIPHHPPCLPTIPPSIRPAWPRSLHDCLLAFHPYTSSPFSSVWTGSLQSCRSPSWQRDDGHLFFSPHPILLLSLNPQATHPSPPPLTALVKKSECEGE